MAITTISALTRAVEGRSDDLFLISRPETNVTNRYYRSFSMGLSAIKNYCVTDMEYLPLSGGTMTGPIVLQTGVSLLDDNPTPKSYVDSADQNLQNKIDALSNKVKSKYLPFSGGTMTGKITLDGNPVADNHATNKKYVDDISVDLQKKIDGKGIDLTGKAGEVAYTTPAGLFRQQIGKKILVCETTQEAEQLKGKAPSMSDIFKTWTKFGTIHVRKKGATFDGADLEFFQDGKDAAEHADENYFKASHYSGSPIGVKEWEYTGAGTIEQPVNTADFTGYVSNKKFNDYELEVRFLADDSKYQYPDDDFNGIIAAYVLDSNNKFHTLSFMRSPNNSNIHDLDETVDSTVYHWYCALDLREPFGPELTAVGNTPEATTSIKYPISQKFIKNSELHYGTGSGQGEEKTKPWREYKNYGVKVKVIREGNVFTAYTTSFSNTATGKDEEEEKKLHPYLDNCILRVDLEDELKRETSEKWQNILKLFINQPVSIGVCTNSQPMSTFKIIKFPAQIDDVVDLQDDCVYRYDIINDRWENINIAPVEYMGPGRIAYNTITKKLFYNDGNAIYRIGTAIDVDTVEITESEDHVPCSKLVNGLKSLISEQVERLRSIV